MYINGVLYSGPTHCFYTVKVNNSTIINKMNDHLLSHIIMARDRYKNVAGLNQHMP
jgi:hypothetical protein